MNKDAILDENADRPSENEEPQGEDELDVDEDAGDDSAVLPVMGYRQFRKRYDARDYHMTKAAAAQPKSIKVSKVSVLSRCLHPPINVLQCNGCKRARIIPFCVLDYEAPNSKCLRCKHNRIVPCDHTNRPHAEELTTFPPLKSMISEEVVDDDDDDEDEDDEARSILSERRSSRTSSRASKPPARKSKRKDDDADEKRSSAVKTRSKVSKTKGKAPLSVSPEPQAPKPDIPTLDFEKLLTYNREQRMGKYFAYAEAVISRIEADLDNTRNRVETQIGEMRRNMQEVARLEYRRGKQDERSAKDAQVAEERARTRRTKSSRHSVDTADQDAEDEEGGVSDIHNPCRLANLDPQMLKNTRKTRRTIRNRRRRSRAVIRTARPALRWWFLPPNVFLYRRRRQKLVLKKGNKGNRNI